MVQIVEQTHVKLLKLKFLAMDSISNKPVFPTPGIDFLSPDSRGFEGLTKREYFAAMAMQGLCAKSSYKEADYKTIAREALSASNELIKQLEVREEKI